MVSLLWPPCTPGLHVLYPAFGSVLATFIHCSYYISPPSLLTTKGILSAIEAKRITGTNVLGDILTIAEVVDIHMGGTSGALYS